MPASFPSGMEMLVLYPRDPWCYLIGSHSVEIALTMFTLLKTKDAFNIRMNAFHLRDEHKTLGSRVGYHLNKILFG